MDIKKYFRVVFAIFCLFVVNCVYCNVEVDESELEQAKILSISRDHILTHGRHIIDLGNKKYLMQFHLPKDELGVYDVYMIDDDGNKYYVKEDECFTKFHECKVEGCLYTVAFDLSKHLSSARYNSYVVDATFVKTEERLTLNADQEVELEEKILFKGKIPEFRATLEDGDSGTFLELTNLSLDTLVLTDVMILNKTKDESEFKQLEFIDKKIILSGATYKIKLPPGLEENQIAITYKDGDEKQVTSIINMVDSSSDKGWIAALIGGAVGAVTIPCVACQLCGCGAQAMGCGAWDITKKVWNCIFGSCGKKNNEDKDEDDDDKPESGDFDSGNPGGGGGGDDDGDDPADGSTPGQNLDEQNEGDLVDEQKGDSVPSLDEQQVDAGSGGLTAREARPSVLERMFPCVKRRRDRRRAQAFFRIECSAAVSMAESRIYTQVNKYFDDLDGIEEWFNGIVGAAREAVAEGLRLIVQENEHLEAYFEGLTLTDQDEESLRAFLDRQLNKMRKKRELWVNHIVPSILRASQEAVQGHKANEDGLDEYINKAFNGALYAIETQLDIFLTQREEHVLLGYFINAANTFEQQNDTQAREQGENGFLHLPFGFLDSSGGL